MSGSFRELGMKELESVSLDLTSLTHCVNLDIIYLPFTSVLCCVDRIDNKALNY